MGGQIVAIHYQFATGLARIGIIGPLGAILAQAVEVRARTRQNEGCFAACGITNHADFLRVDIRRKHWVLQGFTDCLGDLHRPPVQIAQRAQTAVVQVVVARVQNGDYHKAFAHHGGDQIVQRQRCAGIAMGQHQQRETANGKVDVFTGFDLKPFEPAGVRDGRGRVKGKGVHGLLIDRVGEREAMIAHTPVHPGGRHSLGLHRKNAE